MRPEDIARLVVVGDPRLAPDGGRVAFTVTRPNVEANTYDARIWVADTAGGAPSAVTGEAERCTMPRWSADGAALAFVVTYDRHKYEIRAAERSIAVLDARVDALAWSPDGAWIAWTSRATPGTPEAADARDRPVRRIDRLVSRVDDEGWAAGRRRHVWLAPADGSGSPTALTFGDVDDDGLSWSPDGRRLVFASGRHDTWDLDWARDLFTVDVSGGEPARLTATGPSFGSPVWSPDGARIAFVEGGGLEVQRHSQVGVLDVASGDCTRLSTTLDRHCDPDFHGFEPRWDGDGRVVFGVEDGGRTHLYRAALDGSPPVLVVGGERRLSGFDMAAAVVAFTSSTATTLPELSIVVDGDERRVTSFGEDFGRAVALSRPERFTARSADGSEVEAWAMVPAAAGHGPHPTLLNVHGGPFAQYGVGFFDEFQLQVGAGFGVVYCNPRGSSGYAESWARAIRGPKAAEDPGSGWGGVDFEDVMAVVDEAVRRFDWVDGDRLGVLGGSYGGFMTSWIAAHAPDRFRAGCSERSANNLLMLAATSDLARFFERDFGVSHLEDPHEYRRMSPVTYVDRMRMPLLVLHSDDDLRCPSGQADELFVALRMLGREVEYWRFPGESHELSRSGAPRHRVERARIILDWFQQHLAP